METIPRNRFILNFLKMIAERIMLGDGSSLKELNPFLGFQGAPGVGKSHSLTRLANINSFPWMELKELVESCIENDFDTDQHEMERSESPFYASDKRRVLEYLSVIHKSAGLTITFGDGMKVPPEIERGHEDEFVAWRLLFSFVFSFIFFLISS